MKSMLKKLSTTLLSIILLFNIGINAFAVAKESEVLLKSQVERTVNDLQVEFPEANLDANKVFTTVKNAKKGIVPDSHKADAQPIEKYSKKLSDGSTMYLNIYADRSFVSWGKSGGTSSTSGNTTTYSNVTIYYNDTYIWIVSYKINYYIVSGNPSLNTITSAGPFTQSAMAIPVSLTYNSQTATGQSNLIDPLNYYQNNIAIEISGLTLTFDVYSDTVNADVGAILW